MRDELEALQEAVRAFLSSLVGVSFDHKQMTALHNLLEALPVAKDQN